MGGRSGTSVYRDAAPRIDARIGEVRIDIAEREARLDSTFWAAIAPEAARRLADLAFAASRAPRSPEDFARVEEATLAYRDALDDAIARIPRFVADALVVPDHVPDLDEQALGPRRAIAHGRSRDAYAALATSITRLVKRQDPAAAVVPLPSHGLRVRFRARGAPLSLLAGLQTTRTGFGPEFLLLLATSVARMAPRLRLQPETWGDSMLNALHLHRAREVERDGFDGMFTMQGDADARALLLTAPARAALLEVARCDIPTLVVEDGVATLRWSFDPAPAFDAAVRALTAIRGADVSPSRRRSSRRD